MKSWIVGVDPSPDGRHCFASLDPDGELTGIIRQDWIGPPVCDRITIIELPEWQGRGWANLLPVYKQAVLLIGRFLLAGDRVYTPPTRIIWKDLMGNATATDADKLAWLRQLGLQTGRGTAFTHHNSHNVDAYLAALWGRRWLNEPDRQIAADHLGPWLEPRA